VHSLILVDVVSELPTVDRRTVPFVAPDPPRSVPITWGQRALWMAARRHGAGQVMFALKRWVAVPRRAQADPDRVYAALAALLARHSSLRTRLELTGDQPVQLVAAAGELPVLVVPEQTGVSGEPGGSGDPVATARRVAEELASVPFAHAEEWPQRVAVVARDGVPQQVVLVFSHTTVDFRAAELVLRDLRLLLARGRIDTPAGLQSADIAELEQRERHRRRSARAAAYWVDRTRRLPRQTRMPVRDPLTPRFRRGLLVSEAADTALRLAAERYGVTSSTVLLAAAARVVGEWSGNDLVGLHTMVNNRVLAGYPEAIAKLNQLALVPVQLSGSTAMPQRAGSTAMAQLLPRVWQAAVDGYRHGYYDPQELSDAFTAAGLPYAVGVSPHCYLNDIRLSASNDLFGRDVDEAAVRAVAEKSIFRPAEGFDRFTWRMRIEIVDQPVGLGLALTADTTYFSLDEVEEFLRALEAQLVDAAFEG
jgi:hypothetical protein